MTHHITQHTSPTSHIIPTGATTTHPNEPLPLKHHIFKWPTTSPQSANISAQRATCYLPPAPPQLPLESPQLPLKSPQLPKEPPQPPWATICCGWASTFLTFWLPPSLVWRPPLSRTCWWCQTGSDEWGIGRLSLNVECCRMNGGKSSNADPDNFKADPNHKI